MDAPLQQAALEENADEVPPVVGLGVDVTGRADLVAGRRDRSRDCR